MPNQKKNGQFALFVSELINITILFNCLEMVQKQRRNLIALQNNMIVFKYYAMQASYLLRVSCTLSIQHTPFACTNVSSTNTTDGQAASVVHFYPIGNVNCLANLVGTGEGVVIQPKCKPNNLIENRHFFGAA